MKDELNLISAAEKQIVLAFAKSNMNLSKAARKTYMSRHGVEYRLNNVRKKTGLNPMEFYDLAYLVNAIDKERREYDQYQRGGS